MKMFLDSIRDLDLHLWVEIFNRKVTDLIFSLSSIFQFIVRSLVYRNL